MNRRNFVLGLGGFTAATGGVLGTGAFSAAQINDREANIEIASDSDALIGLIPNANVAGVHDDNGELTIDLDEDGSKLNQNSTYQFGYFVSKNDVGVDGGFPFTASNPSDRDSDGAFESAFLIANQTSNEQHIKLDYTLTTDDGEGGDIDTSFWFEIHFDGDRRALLKQPTDDTASVTLGSGEAFGVSFLLDVPGDTLGERIEGSLSITAGEAAN